ncbi:unnamed protein product [Orchesella dallaii]|uniref:Uncharacterized protein n=1 Tax=Orchesella dallaii TaxID=48710 RepID=A0ABP1PQA2_9HEXA
METRIKAENKTMQEHLDQEKMFEAEDAYYNNMALQQMAIDNERKVAQEAASLENKYNRNLKQNRHGDTNDYSNFNAGRLLNQYPIPPEPSYSDFGFRDDEHPQNAIKYPYQFTDNNGHLTLRTPDTQTHKNVSANLAHKSLLMEIMDNIKHFFKRAKDVGIGFYSSSIDSSPEEEHIWFKQKTLEDMADKVGVKVRKQNGNNLMRGGSGSDGYGNANKMDQDSNGNSIHGKPPVNIKWGHF